MPEIRDRPYWDEVLLESWQFQQELEPEHLPTRLEWLGSCIFDFTTYDGSISELFGGWAVEVTAAIHNGKTFEYLQQSDEHYHRYLLMCNIPFFAEKLEWGTSIRGAWWDDHNGVKLRTCGLFHGDEQLLDLYLNEIEWIAFVDALIAFAGESVALQIHQVPIRSS